MYIRRSPIGGKTAPVGGVAGCEACCVGVGVGGRVVMPATVTKALHGPGSNTGGSRCV